MFYSNKISQVIYGHPADIAAHQRIEQEESKKISMYSHPADNQQYGHPADNQHNGEEGQYAQFRKKERTSVYV